MKLSLFHHRETVDERENPFTEQMIADLASEGNPDPGAPR